MSCVVCLETVRSIKYHSLPQAMGGLYILYYINQEFPDGEKMAQS